MVREAARRGLTAALAGLLFGGTAAQAQDLCGSVTIPPEIGLICAPAAGDAVSIAPGGGTFAALSRMTVRALDRAGADGTAWTDPPAWLRA